MSVVYFGGKITSSLHVKEKYVLKKLTFGWMCVSLFTLLHGACRSGYESQGLRISWAVSGPSDRYHLSMLRLLPLLGSWGGRYCCLWGWTEYRSGSLLPASGTISGPQSVAVGAVVAKLLLLQAPRNPRMLSLPLSDGSQHTSFVEEMGLSVQGD